MNRLNTSFLYYTNDDSIMNFDCFYAHIHENMNTKDGAFRLTDYLTPYCRRLSSDEVVHQVEGNVKSIITFENLRSQGITTTHLLQWSILIDIIEEYAIYLTTNNTKYAKISFYNCSSLWFGSHCQYTFNLNTTIESFGDFVLATFDNRKIFAGKITINTCYLHLSGCYRGPIPMCLDWREVCDGKIDCIGDNFGIDEDYCEELEMTECKEDEYRCHNGAQCIPLEFFQDDWLSKDCLDGTDEPYDKDVKDIVIPSNLRLIVNCLTTITFVCEEKTCRYLRAFSCGDGQCLSLPCGGESCILYMSFTYVDLSLIMCPGTRRDFSYGQSIHAATRHLLGDCYKLLFCKLQFYSIPLNDTYNEEDCCLSSNDWLLSLNNCSLKSMRFPSEPIFGYFQFIYSTKNLIDDRNDIILPDYICNDPRQCLYLPKTTLKIEGLDCRSFKQLIQTDYTHTNPISYLYDAVSRLIQRCFLMGNRMKLSSNSSLFYCQSSHRYISKHRLLDRIIDCSNNEDEIYPSTCISDIFPTYSCRWKNKCLSYFGINYSLVNCKTHYDTQNINHQQYIFPRICNGIDDNIMEDGVTDEFNCEFWPCYNPYTRCDNIFQCGNLIDELDCPNYNCTINELKCNIDNSLNYRCIRYDHIYEKPINCIRKDPRLRFSRTLFYSSNFTNNKNEYISWKNTTCITKSDICDDKSSSDQQLVCSMIETRTFDEKFLKLLNMNNNNETMCTLSSFEDNNEAPLNFFSSFHLGYFPSINKTYSQENIKIKPMKSISVNNNTNIELIEYCNRGIIIYEGKSKIKKCLCPPNYYGNQCQWQNQRISLTFQIHQLISFEKKNFIYKIFLYLIDNQNGIIHNYEEINYIPSIDCDTKFDRYLLYPTRPKDTKTKTYSIHIDIYDRITLKYYASWFLLIPFSFLPVNRISTLLIIPTIISHLSRNCSLKCGNHGKCFYYINSFKSFCHCDQGYSGHFCNLTHECSCSSDSICLNSSICLCPINKFGSKCYLKHSSCQFLNPCKNEGECLPVDDRINNKDFICLCNENYMGLNCEFESNKINIHFQIDEIPPIIFAHFITSFKDRKHERLTTFKKVPFNRESITLITKQSFNLLFIEFLNNIYLVVLREEFIPSEYISTNINVNNRCENITKYFNSTILSLTYFDRLKYYQKPCFKNLKLKCLYDEKHICICDENRFLNCFDFIHNMSYNCQGRNECQNNGTCFQDTITCPKTSICMCKKCYYGNKCQLTTKDLSLSLDLIFGYHIKQFISFTKQSNLVKITTTATIIMLIFGFINGIFSILTFRKKSSLDVC